ncbi:MAG: DUF554 domain-containing protein [Anaerovibrio sp.]|uniref:DUF554 domain-containing protein n=1 Tax=Anaerovibrio sp. TaxID=1872532 RepID=UPI0025D609F9|nr:DUF554 domain-containing protein [Anaerovibrio sp.]MCR5175931.1 DUF554 domain-containing protein [Anaerovibrio sp.]
MFAVIVNTLAIIFAVIIGLIIRKGLPENISGSIIKALGLCTVIIGVQGAIKEDNILILIVSIVIGLTIGELLDADGHVNRFTDNLLKKFARKGNSSKLTEAFITSCLIMNVGAMVIVGSLDAGLRSDFTMLYTKSLLDFVAGIMLTAAMGVGVMGSAAFTFLFQGGIVILAGYIAPYLSDAVIDEMSCTGCLLILALGLNMLELTKFKVINYLPALIVAPLVLMLTQYFGF